MIHNDKIEEKLKTLPDNPGVYLMKNSNGKIIYVGKAVVLKNRVRQYFRKTEKTARIEKMVSLIRDFEYIITDTEDEALILECNLIKKYKPKFNVLLKDDKTYPYIKVGEKNGKPIIQLTRNLVKDGSKYYGPYPSVWSAKEMIKYIKDIYMSILNRPFLDETLKNEEKEDEIGFNTKKIAEEYIDRASIMWHLFSGNCENNMIMQFWTDILRKMAKEKYITEDDLYKYSEKEIVDKIKNCQNSEINNAFNIFSNTKKIGRSNEYIEDKYCISIKVKKRYTNPLVNVKMKKMKE